jgi:hypothetical protein
LAPKASPRRSSAAWGFSGLLGEKQGENGWKMDGNVVHFGQKTDGDSRVATKNMEIQNV